MARHFIFVISGMMLALTVSTAHAQTEEIKYLSGGIGVDERAQMAAAEKDYNLKIEMATTSGFYVANAHVIIWDKAGNMMVEATPDGPLMLVALPAGTYTVNIIYQDQEKKQKVTLDGTSHKKLVFAWNGGEEK